MRLQIVHCSSPGRNQSTHPIAAMAFSARIRFSYNQTVHPFHPRLSSTSSRQCRGSVCVGGGSGRAARGEMARIDSLFAGIRGQCGESEFAGLHLGCDRFHLRSDCECYASSPADPVASGSVIVSIERDPHCSRARCPQGRAQSTGSGCCYFSSIQLARIHQGQL